jgi:Domain of unknown function (DUF4292)
MKKTTSLFFILSAAISFLYSCRSTKKIQTVITPKKDTIAVDTPPVVNLHDDSVAFMTESYKSIMANRIDFTTFSAKIDVDYEDAEGKKYNVNAHLRMHKDSIIWISITGPLGIEGVRVYITRDSVKLLDKQNKTYVTRSVSYLQEVTELPLDLPSLQDLLVGNPVFFDDNLISYSKSADAISILSNGDFFKSLFTVDTEKKLPRSAKLDDLGELKNRTCYLTYEDYENKKGVHFAEKRTINVSEKKKLDIKLNFKQYEFNETLSFPFSIPKNYKRES